MGCRGSLEHSDLSKASLVDGFKFPSAIAVTIIGGISLVALDLVKEKKLYMFNKVPSKVKDQLSPSLVYQLN